LTGGEGGIRTLGALLELGALAKLCFRPLSHLTIQGQKHGISGDSRKTSNAESQGLAGFPTTPFSVKATPTTRCEG
jgi:hypothetical protein